MRLNLFVTLDCNMDCTYCYVKNKNDRYMDLNTAMKAIDIGYKRTKPDEAFNVIFSGGEPLLNWDVVRETTKYCRNKYNVGCFGITTNGTLLDEEKMSFFETNNFMFRLSIDGMEDSHDRNRKFKNNTGTYNKVVDAIEMFKKYRGVGKSVKAIRMTITKNNLDRLYNNIYFLLEQGVFDIDLGLNHFDDWDENSLIILSGEISRLADLCIERYESGDKTFYISFFEKIIGYSRRRGKKCAFEQVVSKKNEDFCGLGSRAISISPEGDVYPCSFFVTDNSYNSECLGNILNGEIKPYSFDFDYSNQSSCHKCGIQHRCSSNCIVINRYFTGDGYTPPCYVCEFQKAVILNADKIYAFRMENR